MLNKKQNMPEMIGFRVSELTKRQLVTLKETFGYDAEADFNRDVLIKGLEALQHELDNFEPDLAVIGNKVEKGIELSNAEIAYLGKEAHTAYELCGSDVYDKNYVLDALMATREILSVINLTGDDGRAINRMVPLEHSPRGYMEASIREIDSGQKFNAEYRLRLLRDLCSLDSFKHTDVKKLNQMLNPYLKSLLILSKLAYYKTNKAPAFHFDDYNQFIFHYVKPEKDNPFNFFKYKGEKLSIDVKAEPDMLFTIKHNSNHWLFSLNFPNFCNLRTLLSHIPKERFGSVHVQQMQLLVTNDEATNFCLNVGAHSYYLPLTQLQELANLVRQFEEEHKTFIEANILQWGNI